MTIEITKKLDLNKIKKDILDKQKDILDRAMVEAATGIVQRTTAGINADNGSFNGYSDWYGNKKRQVTGRSRPNLIGFGYIGRNKKRLGSPTPGSMLASITSKITQTALGVITGTIFFNSAKEAAKARGNMRYRNFFALSRDQINRILSLLRGF